MRRIPIRGVLLASTLSLAQWLLPAFAQQPFPVKPARMISPYAPGGGNDVLCRIVAHRLPEGLKQQVIVENRPGANAIVGTEVAARAAGSPGETAAYIKADMANVARIVREGGIRTFSSKDALCRERILSHG